MSYGPELEEFMMGVHGQVDVVALAEKVDAEVERVAQLLAHGAPDPAIYGGAAGSGLSYALHVAGVAVEPFEAAPPEPEPASVVAEPDPKRQEFLRQTLGRIRANLTKFDWRVFVAIVNGVGGMHDLFAVLAYDRSKAGLGGKLLGSLNRLHRKGLIVREDRKAPWQATNPALRGLRVQA